MLAGKGDLLPVSAFPVDGTWPVATAKWEKRNLALEIPVWDSKVCIQCNQCALVCPHAAIRAKVYDESALAGAPPTFKSTPYKGNEHKGKQFTIQVAPEDCTGCNLCVNVCPAKDRTNPKHKAIDMHPQAPLRDAERANYDFFLESARTGSHRDRAARPQELAVPRAAVRVLGRLRGLRRDAVPQAAHAALRRSAAHRQRDRLLVDLRRQPADHAVHDESRRTGPGLVELAVRGQRGVRLRLPDGARRARRRRARPASSSSRRRSATVWRRRCSTRISRTRPASPRSASASIALRRQLAGLAVAEARRLETLADYLVKKSVWLVGGDGWAYDIGYGGLDHVLANRRDVNILVMDTEVYSNTGGQASKATPLGAAAKFAASGKPVGKKDLGLLANMYGHVYVAKVAFGAKMAQTTQAFLEAESVSRTVADHRLQPLHRSRLRHGAGRVAAEAGRRLRRLAALPLRSAAARQGRTAAAPRLRPAEGEGCRLHAQRVALPDGRARRPRSLQDVRRGSQAAAERRYAVYQQLARDHRAGDSEPTDEAAGASRLRGEMMDLGTTYLGMRLPHPLIVGAGPLGDDLDGVQGARGRRRRDVGAALAVRRRNHRRADGRLLQHREPQRVVRRGGKLCARADSRARARRISQPSEADEGRASASR